MSNPYKKAESVGKTPPGGPRKTEPTPVVVTETVPQSEPVVETPAPKAAHGLADMIEQKPEGKSCGFYLSSEAIKKLDKAAKQLKCSKSKALDLLIRKYL